MILCIHGIDGMTCATCLAAREAKIKEEMALEELPPLDHHGAVVNGGSEPSQRYTEMDTPEEFEGLVIQKKLDFAARAVIDKCSDLNRLKACVEPIKKHFSDSFAGWLGKGIPISIDDPLLLTVIVESQIGHKITEAYRTFDFKGLHLPLSQLERLNSNLFELPALFAQVEPALRKKRRVVVYLKWWGTAKQMSHGEFMKDLLKNAKPRSVENDFEVPETKH